MAINSRHTLHKSVTHWPDALVAIMVFLGTVRADTIVETNLDAFGLAYSPKIVFTPDVSPIVVSNGLVWGIAKTASVTNGMLYATVMGGQYTVTAGAVNTPFTVIVPGDGGTHTLSYCAQLATNGVTWSNTNVANANLAYSKTQSDARYLPLTGTSSNSAKLGNFLQLVTEPSDFDVFGIGVGPTTNNYGWFYSGTADIWFPTPGTGIKLSGDITAQRFLTLDGSSVLVGTNTGNTTIGKGGKKLTVYDTGVIAADASGLTNINASALVSGTVPTSVLPAFGGLMSAQIATFGDSMANYLGLRLPLKTAQSVFNGGVGGETSTQTLARVVADTNHQAGCSVIVWTGRNNYGDTNQVPIDISNIVALLQAPKRFIVLPIFNGDFAGESAGGLGYWAITNINAKLASTYGSNYLDVRSVIVAAYNPGIPQDVIDHGNDVPPSSLRRDALHLTDIGYDIVVTNVLARMNALYPTTSATSYGDILSALNSPSYIGFVNPAPAHFTDVTLSNVAGNVLLKGNQIRLQTTSGAGSAIIQPSGDGNWVQTDGYGILMNSGNLWVNSGTVGIKTNNPQADLHVNGSLLLGSVASPQAFTMSGNSMHFAGTHFYYGSQMQFRTSAGAGDATIQNTGDGNWVNVSGTGGLLLNSGNLWVNSGNVGIKTNNPYAALHVVGNEILTGSLGVGTASPGDKFQVLGGNALVGGYGTGTDYGIVYTPKDFGGYFWEGNVAGKGLQFGSGGTIGTTPSMTLLYNGYLGINTNNPQTALHVVGTVTATTTKSTSTNAFILSAPNGGQWIITVNNAGALNVVTNTGGL